MITVLRGVVLGLLFLLHAYAHPQQASPVALTLVNPYPATGAADIAGTSVMTRALRAMQSYATPSTTDALLHNLQRLLVAALAADVSVNRIPRGGGTAAALSVHAAAGATLLFGGSGLTAGSTAPAMRELQPVALVARIPLALVVRSEGSADDIARLLAHPARRNTPLQIGTPGERTAGHWLARLLQRERPGVIAAVSYNGGNGALRGLLARQVHAALAPLPAVLPYAPGQRLRILAISTGTRHAMLPAVPTISETGLAALTVTGWHGLFATPAMSAADVRRLQAALASVLRSHDARDALDGLGYAAEFGDGGVLRRELSEELRRTAPVVVAERVQRSASSGGLIALNILSSVRS